jgi:hypothetical protein
MAGTRDSEREAARRLKYAIEDMIADVSGVTEIHNQVSIASQDMKERMSGL